MRGGQRESAGPGWSAILGAGILLAACATLEWKPIGPRRTEAIAGAERVGSEECLTCHEDVQGHAQIAAYHSDCESCHGGGTLHADTEEVRDIRHPANGDCLACHTAGYDTHLQWTTSQHARAGLLCSDCHNPHATDAHHLRAHPSPSFPRMDAESLLCVTCHQDVAARFTFPSHHPVREGAMSCGSCHDPHEDSRVRFGDRNLRCATCHQAVAGPWVFEHPPAVEDCTLCHDPHGAVARDLLATIEPAICISCHSLPDAFHHETIATGIPGEVTISEDHPEQPGQVIREQEAMTFLRRCSDCHGAIHGSYTDEHLRH